MRGWTSAVLISETTIGSTTRAPDAHSGTNCPMERAVYTAPTAKGASLNLTSCGSNTPRRGPLARGEASPSRSLPRSGTFRMHSPEDPSHEEPDGGYGPAVPLGQCDGCPGRATVP